MFLSPNVYVTMNKTLEDGPPLTFFKIITAHQGLDLPECLRRTVGWRLIIMRIKTGRDTDHSSGIIRLSRRTTVEPAIFFLEGSFVWLPIFTLSRAAVPASVSRRSLDNELAPSWGGLSEVPGPNRQAEFEASQQTSHEMFLLKFGKKSRRRRNVTSDE